MLFKQRGFSLIELMIALMLGAVLMGGVLQMFISSRVVFSTQQAMSRVQESGRLAIEFMTRDIRMAGYMGCLDRTVPPVVDLANPDQFWNDFDVPIIGYASDDVPVDAGLNPEPLDETDVIVVRSANGVPSFLTAANTLNSMAINTKEANLAVGSPVVVSNCMNARIFTPTSLSGATGNITLGHDGGWGGGGIDPSQNFDVGAELIPVFTTVYYIANNPAGRPSLYQRIGAGASLELMDGIEDLSLRFGVDTDGDGVADDYREASAVAWENVRSARIELLVQGNEVNVIDEPQSYTFEGVVVDGPSDRRLRQVFSSTVAVRGRVD